jgi:hypothetical protein
MKFLKVSKRSIVGKELIIKNTYTRTSYRFDLTSTLCNFFKKILSSQKLECVEIYQYGDSYKWIYNNGKLVCTHKCIYGLYIILVIYDEDIIQSIISLV